MIVSVYFDVFVSSLRHLLTAAIVISTMLSASLTKIILKLTVGVELFTHVVNAIFLNLINNSDF